MTQSQNLVSFGRNCGTQLGLDFRVVFIEPFGRPSLACGFDFFGEVFTAGDVSERRRPTSVVTKPINVDHQDKGENHFILMLRFQSGHLNVLCPPRSRMTPKAYSRWWKRMSFAELSTLHPCPYTRGSISKRGWFDREAPIAAVTLIRE